MASSVTLVIGASRGIGRELIQQISQEPSQQVIASVRKPIDLINASNISSIILDQADRKSVQAAAAQVTEIDTLIINAAFGDAEKVLTTSDERLSEYFNVNVSGPLRIVQEFLPALLARQTRRIILISSESGSMTRQINAKGGFSGPYAVSKAAANMVIVQLHNELHDQGFTLQAIHPGWVATDMGRMTGSGGMPIHKSVEGILQRVNEGKHEDSPRFVAFDGSTMPW
jgi:NAD(P)-dependent dehydrogenase (short-subunit alcohol dehydrogenase family)